MVEFYKLGKNVTIANEMDIAQTSGRDPNLPPKPLLMQGKFGRPDKNHSFTVELVTHLKSGYSDEESLQNLCGTHKLIGHLYKTMIRLKDLDFTRKRCSITRIKTKSQWGR